MPKRSGNPSLATPKHILTLLQAQPEGITRTELRRLCNATESAEQFGRRIRGVRELGWKVDVLPVPGNPTDRLYRLGPRQAVAVDNGVNERLRAATIHAAHGRCQMCGNTVQEDGIKLQADHRIPRSWGGSSDLDNLWAICEACNREKRNFFESFDAGEMKEILSYDSEYERIARTLKFHFGRPVPSDYLSFVANFNDYHEDWQKRLRELRYDVIGMEIVNTTKKEGRRRRSYYTMTKWVDLPPNHAALIKAYERGLKAKPKRVARATPPAGNEADEQ